MVDFAAGAAFALAWGLRWQQCAPPSVLCQLPGVACAAICSNGWVQWPATFLWGLLLGLVPSAMAFAALARIGSSLLPTAPMPRPALVLAGFSVLLMGAGAELAFLRIGVDPIPPVLLLVAVVLFVLSQIPGRAGAGPSSRWSRRR